MEPVARGRLPSWVRIRDNTADVAVDSGDGVGDDDATGAQVPGVDITRAYARNGREFVRLRMAFVDLRPVGRLQIFEASITAPNSSRNALGDYWVAVQATPEARSGRRKLYINQAPISCPGFTHEVDYANDRVAMRVPRHCLDDPAWLRVGLATQFSPQSSGNSLHDTANSEAAWSTKHSRRLYSR